MQSGRRGELPLLTPLRTGQASFPASGSSLSNARFQTQRHCCRLHDTGWEPTHACRVGGSTSRRTRHHLQHLQCWLIQRSRAKGPEGSLPAFASSNVAEAQLVSRRLRPGLRFLPLPLPAVPSAHLTARFPEGRRTGLPCSALVTERVRLSLCAASADRPWWGKLATPHPLECRLAEAYQRLWLRYRYGALTRVHMR